MALRSLQPATLSPLAPQPNPELNEYKKANTVLRHQNQRLVAAQKGTINKTTAIGIGVLTVAAAATIGYFVGNPAQFSAICTYVAPTGGTIMRVVGYVSAFLGAFPFSG